MARSEQNPRQISRPIRRERCTEATPQRVCRRLFLLRARRQPSQDRKIRPPSRRTEPACADASPGLYGPDIRRDRGQQRRGEASVVSADVLLPGGGSVSETRLDPPLPFRLAGGSEQSWRFDARLVDTCRCWTRRCKRPSHASRGVVSDLAGKTRRSSRRTRSSYRPRSRASAVPWTCGAFAHKYHERAPEATFVLRGGLRNSARAPVDRGARSPWHGRRNWDRKKTAEASKTAQKSQLEPFSPISIQNREQQRIWAKIPEDAVTCGGRHSLVFAAVRGARDRKRTAARNETDRKKTAAGLARPATDAHVPSRRFTSSAGCMFRLWLLK